MCKREQPTAVFVETGSCGPCPAPSVAFLPCADQNVSHPVCHLTALLLAPFCLTSSSVIVLPKSWYQSAVVPPLSPRRVGVVAEPGGRFGLCLCALQHAPHVLLGRVLDPSARPSGTEVCIPKCDQVPVPSSVTRPACTQSSQAPLLSVIATE
jgi:hypothetical protein